MWMSWLSLPVYSGARRFGVERLQKKVCLWLTGYRRGKLLLALSWSRPHVLSACNCSLFYAHRLIINKFNSLSVYIDIINTHTHIYTELNLTCLSDSSLLLFKCSILFIPRLVHCFALCIHRNDKIAARGQYNYLISTFLSS